MAFWKKKTRQSAPASEGAEANTTTQLTDTAHLARDPASRRGESETTSVADQHMMAGMERREVSKHAAALGPIDKLRAHDLWKGAAALGAPNESILPSARRVRR